jgi:hypothetical protein
MEFVNIFRFYPVWTKRKWQETQEKRVVRSFMLCALHQICISLRLRIKLGQIGGMYRIRWVDEIILSVLLNRRKHSELLSFWTFFFPSPCILETSVHCHVIAGRCSVAASNGGRSPSSGFPNYPRPQLPAILD